MVLTPGLRLGFYELRSKLGEGGMGEVWRALDVRLGRDVAVKVLAAAFAADPDRLRRFEQEARAASSLNHPNLLTLFDLGSEEGLPYLVTELLEGETLRARVAGGELPRPEALDLGVQLLRGLGAAHDQGIIHRDLKPENIFITKDGRAKILDFGLARLHPPSQESASQATAAPTIERTEAGTLLGTAGYMAPEQVRGEPADARSDLFAFGCVLYEMLTGQRAFRGATAVETMSAILREEATGFGELAEAAPASLVPILRRCLEKDPRKRFHSAADLAFALEGSAGSATGSSGAPGARPRVAWRERLAWALTALLGLAALGLALWGRQGASSSQPAALRFELAPPAAGAALRPEEPAPRA